MVDLHFSIANLQEKLSALLKRHAQLEKENQQLKVTIEQQNGAQQKLAQKLEENQAQLTAAMMQQGASMDPAQKAKLIKQIDQYIKEIDHSISNLNP
jgi:chromosome segregation ATPase